MTTLGIRATEVRGANGRQPERRVAHVAAGGCAAQSATAPDSRHVREVTSTRRTSGAPMIARRRRPDLPRPPAVGLQGPCTPPLGAA